MYDTTLSKLLAQVCELTYVQYKNGPPPGNNGKITPPTGYTQIASFTAPEINPTQVRLLNQSPLAGPLPPLVTQNIQSSAQVQDRVHTLFPQIQDVYFGFALTSSAYNIIALRGTQSDFEWALDATIPQVPVPLVWYNDGKFQVAQVHLGFLIFFAMLADQIVTAAKQFNPALPCLVTGHSLGGALAVLASPALKILLPAQTFEMYNFAGPRVGDPIFVDAFNFFVPESYRVVNLSDVVPMLPPSVVFHWQYGDVGEEWSFLNQSGNIAGNHALIGANNYTDAVNLAIPTNAPRVYPVTGLGNAQAIAAA
ncbi:MAG TPA: lipase family protein [Candidatus Angelobacter sp.]|nr:lipase family protein [Candidatus Angelobacter sp.]